MFCLFFNFPDAPNKIKSSSLGDKEATEEDKQVFFELEMAQKYKSSDRIRWTLNGRRIDEDSSKYAIESEGKTVKFIIKNVKLEDEGNYQAELNNTRATGYLLVNGNDFKNQIIMAKLVVIFLSKINN